MAISWQGQPTSVASTEHHMCRPRRPPSHLHLAQQHCHGFSRLGLNQALALGQNLRGEMALSQTD